MGAFSLIVVINLLNGSRVVYSSRKKMASPAQSANAALKENEYRQSPSGRGVSYVLKESHEENKAVNIGSPKLASPYASKNRSHSEITQKIEETTARRSMLMDDIKTKNREHIDRVNQVRRSLAEKEQSEQELKKKQIEEKLLSAQENKMKGIEMIKDKCHKEEKKIELVHARRQQQSSANSSFNAPESQEDMEN